MLHSRAVICDTVCPERYADDAKVSAWVSQNNVATTLGVEARFCTPCLRKLSTTSAVEALYPCRHSCCEICGAGWPVRWAASEKESAWAFQVKRGGPFWPAGLAVFWFDESGLQPGLERGGEKALGCFRYPPQYTLVSCMPSYLVECKAFRIWRSWMPAKNWLRNIHHRLSIDN